MGTWALLFVGAAAAFCAYKTASSARATAQLKKASLDLDAFVKACILIGDEASFAHNYALVLENAARLQHATFSGDRKTLIGAGDGDPDLAAAVREVLDTLEKVALIFEYATNAYTANESFISAHAGSVAIKAHEALASIIYDMRQDNPSAYERFEQLYSYCKHRR